MNSRHTHSRSGRVAAVGAVVVAGALVGVVGVGALVDADRPAPSTLRVGSDDHRAIVELARTAELAGLSPASLTPQPNDLGTRAAELAAIAEFARTNGLTGLSPASMGPVSPAP